MKHESPTNWRVTYRVEVAKNPRELDSPIDRLLTEYYDNENEALVRYQELNVEITIPWLKPTLGIVSNWRQALP